jgi:hypothetical protein
VRERARGASRRLAWIGVAAVAAGVAVFALRAESGCATHQCDPDRVSMGTPVACTDSGVMDRCEGGSGYGTAYLNGREIVWESSGQDTYWLHYPGQRTFVLDWSEAVSCQLGIDPCILTNDYVVTDWEAYVSALPQNFNENSVSAAGQLAELTCLSSTNMCIMNATCAEYYLRVVVRLGPNLNAGMEAGEASDAGLSDASDAPSDASIDAADATQDAPRAD